MATVRSPKSPPDGYTMVSAFNGPLAFAPLLHRNCPTTPQKDLAPVIITSSQPNVLAINAQLPIHSLAELVAYAKANPGKLNYASVGNGSSSHLTMELFKSDGRHRRRARAVQRLAACGHRDDPERDADDVRRHAAAAGPDPGGEASRDRRHDGQALRAAARHCRRSPKSGYPGFEALAWNGILVPAATPQADHRAAQSAEINAILKEPDVVRRLNAHGFELIGGTPEDFSALIKTEADKWAPVIEEAGIKVD